MASESSLAGDRTTPRPPPRSARTRLPSPASPTRHRAS